jgi:DNA-binding transcriptional MerR regulator
LLPYTDRSVVHQEPIRRRPGGTGRGAGPNREIPDKLYFRIGEVAKLCEVPAYVLRFWESEFPQFKPNKGGTGQRLYRRRDVEMALRIKTLLYDEGYTIPGARQVLKTDLKTGREGANTPSEGRPESAETATPNRPVNTGINPDHLEALRKELQDLHAIISRPAARSTVQVIRPPRVVPAKSKIAPTPFPKPQHMLDRERARGFTDLLFDDLDLDGPDPSRA